MRSSKSRSRNKNNRNTRSVGNVVNRVFDSSGPEGKVRGTPQQIIEKYNQLARDAQLSGDRVALENFQQHAEHYTRLLASAQKEQDARQEAQQQQQQNQQARADRAQDRNTNQRHNAQGNADGSSEDFGSGDQPSAAQPDVIEADASATLVETPEAKADAAPKAARKPRARARAKAPKEDVGASSDASETPAAE
jgi:hypothetical protein